MQAEQVLGMTADELAALKEDNGVEAYEAVLKGAQWKEWQMRVQSKSQCAPLAALHPHSTVTQAVCHDYSGPRGHW